MNFLRLLTRTSRTLYCAERHVPPVVYLAAGAHGTGVSPRASRAPTCPPGHPAGMVWPRVPTRAMIDGYPRTKISAVPLRSEKTSEATPGPPFATPGRAAHQAPTDSASADGLLPQSRGCRRRPDPRLRLRIGRRARDDDATSGILVKHLVKGEDDARRPLDRRRRRPRGVPTRRPRRILR